MKTPPAKGLSYAAAGVDTDKEVAAVLGMTGLLQRTYEFRARQRPMFGMDFFANVIDLGGGIGLALSTDGVGSKVLIAQKMKRYDTIGIDCVATNVNDVICVGAEPIAMLDYIGVQQAPDPEIFGEIAKGLYEGARRAGISIPGGETAQLPDIIRGEPGGYAMDLVGTCVGIVALDRIIIGEDLAAGDAIVGLRSSGIHSNGLTLARKVLLERGRLQIDSYVPELGRTVGEELLEPTKIYVKDVLALKNAVTVKALANITSDGFLNLTRVRAGVSYEIECLPDPQAIFQLIKREGSVADEEMYQVFNMGIGFCAIVAASDADRAAAFLNQSGCEAHIIGRVTDAGDKSVTVRPAGLVGRGDKFSRL
jgi:phosphoribosylformylglycinamidine cyclo-ligase